MTTAQGNATKEDVREFWDRQSCGEAYALGSSLAESLSAQERTRYELEPFIPSFAEFGSAAGKHVLEIGVGMGADHMRWAASSPARLAGIDLTPRAVEFTRARLASSASFSELQVADAENLPFADASFDIVYSWGVLHHSPDTARAVNEVRRVLRPGGRAKVMIYHRRSIVGALLWLRYAALRFDPGSSLDEMYARYLESPGTKAYTIEGAQNLFRDFRTTNYRIELSPADLMTGVAGQRHGGWMLSTARTIWPRALIRATCRQWGLFLLVDATK